MELHERNKSLWKMSITPQTKMQIVDGVSIPVQKQVFDISFYLRDQRGGEYEYAILNVKDADMVTRPIEAPVFHAPVGLDDRDGREILPGDKMLVKVIDEQGDIREREGFVRWSKYLCGYSLQNEHAMNVAIFHIRSPFMCTIQETKDGRIDGVIIEDKTG